MPIAGSSQIVASDSKNQQYEDQDYADYKCKRVVLYHARLDVPE